MRKTDRSTTPQPKPVERRAQAPRKARRIAPTPAAVGNGEDPRVILGRVVHRHRIRLGISQEDLANQVELDRTYIGGIERGIRNPTLLVLLRLAVVLGVTPAELLAEQPGSGTA